MLEDFDSRWETKIPPNQLSRKQSGYTDTYNLQLCGYTDTYNFISVDTPKCQTYASDLTQQAYIYIYYTCIRNEAYLSIHGAEHTWLSNDSVKSWLDNQTIWYWISALCLIIKGFDNQDQKLNYQINQYTKKTWL